MTARAAAIAAADYDGATASAIATRLGLPRVVLYRRVGSTMDAAHALGEVGAPAGTLLLADEQTAGRGRQGNTWRSPRSRGIWLTLLERPDNAAGLEVLSLRVGVAVARALDPFATAPVRVKWPNDLFVGSGKVAGVLVEARWRGRHPDWIAVGLGVNIVPPVEIPGAAGLREGSTRLEILDTVVPALRGAAMRVGPLDARELAEFEVRDYARGRRCVLPFPGVVGGVTASGELLVETAAGVRHYRAGSLALEDGA